MLSKPVAIFLRPIASAGSEACSVGIKRESFVAGAERLFDIAVKQTQSLNISVVENCSR
jgi:hypothetical protein